MELTPRARGLIEPVERLCAQMDGLLQPPDFDPAVLERRFVINTVDYVAFRVAAAMLPRLAVEAPQVDLQFVPPNPLFPQQFLRNQTDFAIMPLLILKDVDATGSLRHQPLFREEHVAVVGPEHPLARLEAPTDEDFEQERHLMYHPGENWDETRLGAISGRPARARIMGRFEQVSLLPLLAVATGTVAVVPRSFAELMARWAPLRILPAPGRPPPIDVHLVWSSLHEQDLAHIWFRRRLAEVMAAEPG